MLTQIINARILTPQGWLKDGSVLIRDNKILEVTNCDLAIVGATLIDAKGMYIVPGGVEIHVHGGGGRDFMEGSEDAFRAAIKAHMQHGTTSIFPTLSSSTIPMIRAAAETTEKLMSEPDSPVLGLHLEGHYFNMKMAGGQMPENIKNPDPEEYIPLLEETHCIKRWDAAPELPGAMQFGKYITSKGYWQLLDIHKLSLKTSIQDSMPVILTLLISIMRCRDSTNVANTSTKEL